MTVSWEQISEWTTLPKQHCRLKLPCSLWQCHGQRHVGGQLFPNNTVDWNFPAVTHNVKDMQRPLGGQLFTISIVDWNCLVGKYFCCFSLQMRRGTWCATPNSILTVSSTSVALPPQGSLSFRNSPAKPCHPLPLRYTHRFLYKRGATHTGVVVV